LLIEKLRGSDWNSIETVFEQDNVYVYRFDKQGEPIYLAWWDWWNETGETKEITLSLPHLTSAQATITESVPNALMGQDLNPNDYPNFFNNYTADLAPYPPSNPSPSDIADGIELINPILSWSSGDPDPGDTVTYDVYFGRLDPPNLISTDLADTTFTLGRLNCFTTYYWQVIARDNHGAETSGPLWSFTTTDVGCPVIENFYPNPGNPSQVVVITGRNFGDTKGVLKVGKRRYKRKRILLWGDTRIAFRVMGYRNWLPGTTRTKNVMIKVGPVGERINSNKMPLTIIKP
jgi:hypothetical protein